MELQTEQRNSEGVAESSVSWQVSEKQTMYFHHPLLIESIASKRKLVLKLLSQIFNVQYYFKSGTRQKVEPSVHTSRQRLATEKSTVNIPRCCWNCSLSSKLLIHPGQ